MKKLFAGFLGRVAKIFGVEQEFIGHLEPQKNIEYSPSPQVTEEILAPDAKKTYRKKSKKQGRPRGKKVKDGEIVVPDPRDIRDIIEAMEFPFVSLSKNRIKPIIYESPDGGSKVRISGHPPHYVASIYDWDVILFVASKLQEILNSGKDTPPRTLIIKRHELLKALYKHDASKQQKDMKASLNRLKSTLIETTIRNEDGRYEAGFGFLDSWGYTDRKDKKEIRITLSQWLYDGICRKGSLLKVSPEYFKITSGLKKFLYRTARKHVGTRNSTWDFSIESLYAKSGSEREFKKFKHDLRKVVSDNDIPAYFMKWVEEDGKTFVRFINKQKELEKVLSGAPNHKPV
jgi:plasmid replication initiation protein